MAKFLFFSGLLLLVSSCTQKANDNAAAGAKSKLQLVFPKALRQKVQTANAAFDYNNGCYAISITAEDIPNGPETPCDRPYGLFSGMVTPTASPETDADNQINVEVPFGENRLLTIYALDKAAGTGACPQLIDGEGFGAVPRNKLYKVGETPFSNNTEELSVQINIAMPAPNAHLMNAWSLPSSCPVSQTDTSPIAGVGERRLRQTGGKFVLDAKSGGISRPQVMSGGKFVVEVKKN